MMIPFYIVKLVECDTADVPVESTVQVQKTELVTAPVEQNVALPDEPMEMLTIKECTEHCIMKSIIKKLYWGEVMPCKEPSPNTQKYKDTKEHLDRVESEILKQFPALSNDLDEYRETM